jgi:RNA-binding protein Musashi
LQRDVSSEDFREHFAAYGVIDDAAIVLDQNGISRGFGFVTYTDSKSVEKALIVKHTFGDRIVDCKRAVPKDELRNQV